MTIPRDGARGKRSNSPNSERDASKTQRNADRPPDSYHSDDLPGNSPENLPGEDFAEEPTVRNWPGGNESDADNEAIGHEVRQNSAFRGHKRQPSEEARNADSQESQQRVRSGFRRTLGDKLLSGLFESGEVLRRGQGLVSEVAQVTKDEMLRIVGSEVRTFLDKVDVSDLVQEIMSGLVLEVKTEVRFNRDDSGKISPKTQKTQTRVRSQSRREEDCRDGQEFDRNPNSSETTRSKKSANARVSGFADEEEP